MTGLNYGRRAVTGSRGRLIDPLAARSKRTRVYSVGIREPAPEGPLEYGVGRNPAGMLHWFVRIPGSEWAPLSAIHEASWVLDHPEHAPRRRPFRDEDSRAYWELTSTEFRWWWSTLAEHHALPRDAALVAAGSERLLPAIKYRLALKSEQPGLTVVQIAKRVRERFASSPDAG